MRIPPDQAGRIAEEDAPTWAVTHPVPPLPDPDRRGVRSLLLLDDEQHHLEEQTFFVRRVFHLPSFAAVQKSARISIEFSPESEQVVFHGLRIRRGDGEIDLLPVQTVRILHREEAMEWHILTGRLLAVLLLEGVRAGDTIDYSYSRRQTREPILKRVSGAFPLHYSFPVKALRKRLVYGPTRLVYAWLKNSPLEARMDYTPDGLIDCRWEADEVPEFESEPNIPVRHSPWGAVRYGEFESWEQVVEALSPLYAFPDSPLPPSLAALLAEPAATPEERIVRILRHVQDEIRYVSVFGEGEGHLPSAPATVVERCYGDCKDKTVLLCRLLREIGCDAVPALVNTKLRAAVADELPGPVFDHAIVRLRHDGATYWLDGTCAGQGGTLERLVPPPFELALILGSPGETFGRIAASSTLSVVFCDECIKAHRTEGSAELRVERRFEMASADRMRHHLASVGLDVLDKEYLEEYRSFYPEIELEGVSTCIDKRDVNHLKIITYYKLSNIWRPLPDGVRNGAVFRVGALFRVFRQPPPGPRRHPFALEHPLRITASMDIRLPAAFGQHRSNDTIETSAFRCDYRYESGSSSARSHVEYVSLKDEIVPDEVEEHRKALNRMSGLTSRTVFALERVISRGIRNVEREKPRPPRGFRR